MLRPAKGGSFFNLYSMFTENPSGKWGMRKGVWMNMGTDEGREAYLDAVDKDMVELEVVVERGGGVVDEELSALNSELKGVFLRISGKLP